MKQEQHLGFVHDEAFMPMSFLNYGQSSDSNNVKAAKYSAIASTFPDSQMCLSSK